MEADPNASAVDKALMAVELSTVCNMLDFVKGDKTELQAYYDEVKDLDLDLYVDGKEKDDFIAALQNAFDVLESEESIQKDVDDAKTALEAARDALIEKQQEVDKSALQEAIRDAEAVDLNDYISTGQDAFTDALADAKEIFENPDATQQQVNDATEALKAAQSDLIQKADKTELEEAIQNAEKIDTDDFTSTGKQEFIDKLEAAKEVLANEDASQADVDKAAEELKAAQDSLVAKADKTKLDEAIKNAEGLTSQDFDAAGTEAYKEFLFALADAKNVQADPDATQQQVDAATQRLIDAAKAAAKQADKSELEEAIKEAESLTPKTDELDKAIEEAKKVLDDKTLTNMDQAIVDKAAQDLKAAIEEWKKTHTDQTNPTPEDPDKKDDNNKTTNTKTGEASTAAAGILLAAGCAAVLTRKRKNK